MQPTRLSLASLVVAFGTSQTWGYDGSASSNLAVYWGQNSYGATHTSSSNTQQNISHYCQDDTIDAIPIAFLDVFFDTGGLPSIDLANVCNVNDNEVFPGTDLPECTFMASDIETCQDAGKIVTLSLGGATGSNTFANSSQAQDFADTVWNLFLGGASDTRPFGDAVLDGVDLDIEGGSTSHYTDFIQQLRSHMDNADKTYYITGAPQCPYPDAYLGNVINDVGFDALYVQFYNNYCGVNNYDNSNDWDYSDWDDWAQNTSPNKDVKIFIGAPASSTAANSGYVDAATLGAIAQQTRANYSSFGGVMLWDASQAYGNDRYDQAIKGYLTNSSTAASVPPSTNGTDTQNKCAGVAGHVSNVRYYPGAQVAFNGNLYIATSPNEKEFPGSSDAWQNEGLCADNSPLRVRSRLFKLD